MLGRIRRLWMTFSLFLYQRVEAALAGYKQGKGEIQLWTLAERATELQNLLAAGLTILTIFLVFLSRSGEWYVFVGVRDDCEAEETSRGDEGHDG
jgi:hypothetical protein